jgi:cold-inducible RNA-binding protein
VKNIFVGNLDLETSAESIRSLFEPIGTVRNLKLMLDRKTGVSRGFAFVEMIEPEADKAIASLDGRVLDGRAIDVHEARPKLRGLASPESVIRRGSTPPCP